MTDEEFNPRKSERAIRMINDALEEMHRRRSEYRRARRMGSVTVNNQAAFQSAVVDVYDELYPYRERVADKWEKFALDNVHKLDNQTTERTVYNSTGGTRKLETVVEPYRIPCETLLNISKKFDDVAMELGFSAPLGVDIAGLDEAEI